MSCLDVGAGHGVVHPADRAAASAFVFEGMKGRRAHVREERPRGEESRGQGSGLISAYVYRCCAASSCRRHRRMSQRDSDQRDRRLRTDFGQEEGTMPESMRYEGRDTNACG